MNYDKLPYLMTRKDIASLIGMSWQWVKLKEKELGLHQCKIQWSSNRARYRRDSVVSQLKRIGVL